MTAREVVLERVRAALASASPANSHEGVPRSYRQQHEASTDRASLFADRVSDYRATIHRVGSAGEVAAAIAGVSQIEGIRELGVAPGVPEEWLPASNVAAVRCPDPSAASANRLGGALTGCALAIAETGTIALDGGALSGRRMLTLIPDLHLCVVASDQIVGGLPEAIGALRPAVANGMPITFVSGPSATSDIELHRVEGVHGPRRLHVILLRGDE
ncbi:MAG: LUD domain-containing protein [bacterium]